MTQTNPMEIQIQALIEQGHLACFQAQYVEAEQSYEQALTLGKQYWGLEHPQLAPLFTALGEVKLTQHRFSEATTMYNHALGIYDHHYGQTDERTLAALGDVAGSREEHWPEEAEEIYQETITLSEKHVGPQGFTTGLLCAKLARLYRATGRYALAEPLFERALKIMEDVADPTWEQRLHHAICLNNAAFLYLERDRCVRAEQLLRRAISIKTRLFGSQHLALAGCFKNLARASMQMQEWALAQLLLQRAQTLFEQFLGADHPDTLALKPLLASVMLAIDEQKDTPTTEKAT